MPDFTAAWGETGSGRIGGKQCPNETEALMVYSPFKPYWKFEMFAHNVQKCWVATDCLFEAAGESRKLQFSATALVMGLIPFSVKDIAWPERRLIFVTKRLHWGMEILVLALGLVPMETKNQKTTRKKGCEGTMLAPNAWAMQRSALRFWIFVCTAAVLGCYASLVVMEVYSKRSALGCPFPLFIAAWHVIALIPAAIHSLFARFRRQRYRRRELIRRESLQGRHEQNDNLLQDISLLPLSERPKLLHRTLGQHLDIHDEIDDDEGGKDREKKIVSAVQGADQDWPVQMAWGVYYVAGTLCFTSIMAVTVIELVVWVVLGLATTGCSKILAFFLCLVFEETGLLLPSGLRETEAGVASSVGVAREGQNLVNRAA
jgi:hypothetical protein